MEYRRREYPFFSACGLNCGLCPRYHTEGKSRCPGCAGNNFSAKHPSCGVLSCCQRNQLDYCYQCEEFPCNKYDDADKSDSFITHKNQFSDFSKAKKSGIEAYKSELNSKIEILQELLAGYDDGRRKSFYCVAVNLLELNDIQNIMLQLRKQSESASTQKERVAMAARLFQETACENSIDLKLRKRSKS